MPTPDRTRPTTRTPTVVLASVSCALAMLVVGASFVASATVAQFPLLGGQAVRYAVAAAVLVGVLVVRRVPWVVPTARQTGRLAALAATGLVAFSVLVVRGADHADPSLVGAVVGATPLVLLLAGALRERRLTVRATGAALAVLVGVVLVEGPGAVDPLGLALAVGALACEVCFSLLAVPLLPVLGPLRVSAYACVLAVPQLVLAGLVLPGPFLVSPTRAELVALAYLAVVVTAVAFLLWYSGLAVLGPGRAGLFAGLMPVGALAASVLLGVEDATPHAVAGVLAVGLGLLAGLRPARSRQAAHRIPWRT
ncbi:DMT family transporter [Cellulosimicrobium marinum]|uniref:DMT family transporter n=1 Tax=Cellulosimicrobium marinum TaxID=1638992 RepID=UPI001E40C862|nr:DMT family transporter [Cellulosimicrobium marinum]MCB7138182.1 DMT family transporter [Cellulosimicrobium marinum]